MIPQETVNLILDTAQIADVVGDYVTLRRRGANYVACCPFHNEKTPSFYVSPAKGIYKCFGCGKSGTAVGFVMEEEHCSYVEALRLLARKYNIEIVEEEESPEELMRRQRRESLLLSVIALPASLLGMWIGALLDKRVSDRLSHRFIIYVFILGGVSTSIYALLQLI